MKYIIIILFFCSNAYAGKFKDILEQAVNSYPVIIKETNQLEYNKASRLKAYSQFLPSINLKSSKTEDKEDNVESDYSQKSITSSLNLFKFGSDVHNVQKEHADYDKQSANIKLKRFNTEEEISSDIFNYLENKKTIIIQKKILSLKSQALKKAKKRYELGRLSKQDLNKIKIDHLNAQSDLSNKKIASLKHSQKIFEYTGKKLVDLDWPWNIELAERLIKKLKNNSRFKHPGLEYSKSLKSSAELSKKSLFGSMLGSMDLSYSKSLTEYNSGDVDDERITLSFTIPLFSKFSDYADYKQTQVNVQYAQAYDLYNQRKLKNNKTNSSLVLFEAIDTYRKRNETLSLSDRIYKNSLKQFEKGLISVNDLVLEENRLLKTQEFANSGNKSLHNAIVQFCHANGKEVLVDCL